MSKKALQVHSTHIDQTVETEENENSKSTNERGQFPWFVRFLSCLGCYSQPGTKYDFPHVHFFTLLVPIAQQPGQAVVLGRLSLCLNFVNAIKTGDACKGFVCV
jgi:hypothetical protein